MPEPISDEESLRRLREFLGQLKKLLADLAQNPRPALLGRYHESMQAAWPEVESNFQTVIDRLQGEPNTPLSDLKERGLTGPQLIFKLTVFQHVHGALIDHGTPQF